MVDFSDEESSLTKSEGRERISHMMKYMAWWTGSNKLFNVIWIYKKLNLWVKTGALLVWEFVWVFFASVVVMNPFRALPVPAFEMDFHQ